MLSWEVICHCSNRMWPLRSHVHPPDKNSPLGQSRVCICSFSDPVRPKQSSGPSPSSLRISVLYLMEATSHASQVRTRMFLTSTGPQPIVMRSWVLTAQCLLQQACPCHPYGCPPTDLSFHQVLHIQAYMNLLEGRADQDPSCSHRSEEIQASRQVIWCNPHWKMHLSEHLEARINACESSMLCTRPPESLQIELDCITDSTDVFPLVIIFLTFRNLSFVNVISSGSTRLSPRVRMNRNPRQILYKILRKK